MTIPTFLNETYAYSETAVTTVASVISALRSILVTTLGWTEPSANRFKSVVDASGRFFDVLVTNDLSVTYDELEWRVRDQNGNDVMTGATRAARIDTAGTTVRIFATRSSVFVEFVRNDATFEHLAAGMLDESPESQVSHTTYVYANATRTSTGAADGNFANAGQWYMIDNGTAAQAARIKDQGGLVNGSIIPLFTGSGALLFLPMEFSGSPGATVRFLGRMFQAYICDSSLGFGAEKSVPLDDVTNGTFKVVSLATFGTALRLMLRKS